MGLLVSLSVAALLKPLADHMRGPRALRAVVAGLIFLLAVAMVLTGVSMLLVEPIRVQMQAWPQMKESLNGTLWQVGATLGMDKPPDVDTLLQELGAFLVGRSPGSVFSLTANVSSLLLVSLIFVFFGSIYLLAEGSRRMIEPIASMLPEHRRQPLRDAVAYLEPRLRWWLLGTFIAMAMIGAASYAGFLIIGLHFALPLAMVMALSEAVPTVGPATAFVIVTLFAAPQGWAMVIGVVAVYIIVQGLESNVVLPVIMKRVVDIPGSVTLFTVVLWGQIFGIIGLLLAVPIDLVIWSAIRHFIIEPRRPRVVVPTVRKTIITDEDQLPPEKAA
jgi:predicted PurR-regulated permease PerM